MNTPAAITKACHTTFSQNFRVRCSELQWSLSQRNARGGKQMAAPSRAPTRLTSSLKFGMPLAIRKAVRATRPELEYQVRVLVLWLKVRSIAC